MIVAMENFIPDRLAVSAEKKSAPAPVNAQIYASAWLRGQQATTIDPQPSPAPDHQEDSPGVPACPGVPPSASWKPEFTPSSAGEAPPNPGPSQSTFANPFRPSEAPPLAPYVPGITYVPDLRVPFSIKKNPFARPR
jgi:hypothetical protein